MDKYDVWIDVECSVAEAKEVVCTLFAKRDFAVRPLRGESITFWSKSDALASFNIVTVVGIQTVHYLPTEIEDLAHHFRPGKEPQQSQIHLRCLAAHVPTIQDARKLVAFMGEQHGFEVDPYGVNKLES